MRLTDNSLLMLYNCICTVTSAKSSFIKVVVSKVNFLVHNNCQYWILKWIYSFSAIRSRDYSRHWSQYCESQNQQFAECLSLISPRFTCAVLTFFRIVIFLCFCDVVNNKKLGHNVSKTASRMMHVSRTTPPNTRGSTADQIMIIFRSNKTYLTKLNTDFSG